MASCSVCDKWFRTEHACTQHARAVHSECQYCDRFFWNDSATQAHEDRAHSWECDYCNYEAAWESTLNEHLSSQHSVCITCKKKFRAPFHLQQHLNSGIHQNGPTTTCPFCQQQFRKFSALTMHLENGNCPNKPLTRNDVKQYVRHREHQLKMPGTILAPRITYHNNEVPSHATVASWNGRAYECCICSRQFQTLGNLNAHLISHEPKDYRCASCDRRFNVLSAVIQHWELSGCGCTVSQAARELAQFRITF